jgi:Ni,Fe-hydrogenase I large subunit
MARRSRMLDEALAIGRQELDLLVAGDVFEAEKMARSREQLLSDAMSGLSGDNLKRLADRLVEMKTLHDRITGEAKKLKQALKQDLSSMKRQNRRISGYSFGAGNMPRLAKERFINKKG